MDGIDEDFMEFFGQVGKAYGIEGLPAKVIAILYIEPGEVSMEEVAARTGYSLASISTTMKFLEGAGIFRRIKKPGTNKAFFYMEKDLARLNVMKMEAARENLIKPAKKTLPQIAKKYKGNLRDDRAKKKLKLIEDYYAQMLRFESMLDHWIGELEEMSAEWSKKRG